MLLKDDTHPRYADVSMRQSRARLDYSASGGSAQYEDSYGERSLFFYLSWMIGHAILLSYATSFSYCILYRLGRSHVGYGSSRSSISGRDSHGLYGGRHGMGYSGGSHLQNYCIMIYLITCVVNCLRFFLRLCRWK